MLNFDFRHYTLDFKFPAGTSRGILTQKDTFILRIKDTERPDHSGYGEVPVFAGLSKESVSDVKALLENLKSGRDTGNLDMDSFPSSVRMGIESALSDLNNGGKGIYFKSDFTEGKSTIIINGLIWMGDFSKMKSRIDAKISSGFKCIKIKIGAIDWDKELELLQWLRKEYGYDLQIRLDANGAFSFEECLPKLDQLSKFKIHSIEQPLRQGQVAHMAQICRCSPIPIALDEELIGIGIGEERSELLEEIKPDFIILKPALCYGFSGALDWIQRAEDRGIGWWLTSALESSVGLDVIAQFTGSLSPSLPQGLGTGNLFINNFPSPLSLVGERLSFIGPSFIFRSGLDELFNS